MFTTRLTALALLVASTCVLIVDGQRLNKRVLAPDKPRQLEPSFNHLDNMPFPGAGYGPVSGALPNNCRQEAEWNNCPQANMKRWLVEFDDCKGAPWYICHCERPNSPPVTNLIHMLGRVPNPSRAFIRTFMAIPPHATSPYAYARGNDIVTFHTLRFVTMLHETTHVIDGANGLSAHPDWTAAINADTCVISDYANTNRVENLSEVGSLILLEMINPGEYNRLSNSLGGFGCLSNQLRYARRVLTRFYSQSSCPPRQVANAKLKTKRGGILGGFLKSTHDDEEDPDEFEPASDWFISDHF